MNEGLLQYEAFVKKTVGMIHKKYKSRYDFEDLKQQAYMYLLEFQKTYDESRGASFFTYVYDRLYYRLLIYIRDDRYFPSKNREERLKGYNIICSTEVSVDDNSEKHKIIYLEDAVKEEEVDYALNLDVKVSLNLLSDIEKKVIIGLFYKRKTQMKLAEELNTRQVQISRVKDRALKKLNNYHK